MIYLSIIKGMNFRSKDGLVMLKEKKKRISGRAEMIYSSKIKGLNFRSKDGLVMLKENRKERK